LCIVRSASSPLVTVIHIAEQMTALA